MKKLISVFAFVCLSVGAHAQNLTSVSASNITDINGTKLAAGQLCFLITDQQDNPISVSIGGGGQALKRGYCSAIAAGVVTTSFTVPNPAATLPSGIYYRVTVKDSSTGQEVLRYTGVSFAGATFNFDNYAPVNLGSLAPLTGTSVSGNLAVSGNVAATGTVTGSNIPGAIPGAGSCTNQFVRTLNNAASPTCNTVGSLDLASSLALTTPNIGAAAVNSLTFNSASLGTGAVLTVGGTSATSGGISIFVGASGSSTERLSVVPADGASAAARVGSLSVRTPSAGFLTGTEVASISTTGAYTTRGGINLQTSSGTLPALVTNDSSGGVQFTTNGGKSVTVGNTTGHIFLPPAAGLFLQGATSGTVSIAAPPVAGSNNIIIPAANDTLVGKATTDTLTNKTLTSPTITNPTFNSGVSQGSGVKHQRFGASCTTPAALGGACNSTYTWTTGFADANYSVVCTGDSRSGTALGIPVVINTNSIGASTFLLSIAAFSGTAAQFPAVDCIAFHD